MTYEGKQFATVHNFQLLAIYICLDLTVEKSWVRLHWAPQSLPFSSSGTIIVIQCPDIYGRPRCKVYFYSSLMASGRDRGRDFCLFSILVIEVVGV